MIEGQPSPAGGSLHAFLLTDSPSWLFAGSANDNDKAGITLKIWSASNVQSYDLARYFVDIGDDQALASRLIQLIDGTSRRLKTSGNHVLGMLRKLVAQ